MHSPHADPNQRPRIGQDELGDDQPPVDEYDEKINAPETELREEDLGPQREEDLGPEDDEDEEDLE